MKGYSLWVLMSQQGAVEISELTPEHRVIAGLMVRHGLAQVRRGLLRQRPEGAQIDRWTSWEALP